jgi:hypothetical protein
MSNSVATQTDESHLYTRPVKKKKYPWQKYTQNLEMWTQDYKQQQNLFQMTCNALISSTIL